MQSWMLEAPQVKLPHTALTAFEVAWTTRDLSLLPSGMPRWLFLRWLEGQGVLFHGSPHDGLSELRPLLKEYNQPDEFSNRTGVYAASDGLWAMMYALRGPAATGMMDMGLRLRVGQDWSPMRYFMSLATDTPVGSNGRDLLGTGTVYVLSRDGFEPSAPYQHPGLGEVHEMHCVSPQRVRPLMAVAVTPQDFPLLVRVHDAARVRALAAVHPWGFPWLGT
ncbi:hypothetical protein [Deinococcus sp.]|uniref:hypothetical protein n=1 Tax=Deinococcus sp. TaxID=47478 RepID=UPI002869BA67|nr:hypothetical protein [Deinococcus sp.]